MPLGLTERDGHAEERGLQIIRPRLQVNLHLLVRAIALHPERQFIHPLGRPLLARARHTHMRGRPALARVEPDLQAAAPRPGDARHDGGYQRSVLRLAAVLERIMGPPAAESVLEVGDNDRLSGIGQTESVRLSAQSLRDGSGNIARADKVTQLRHLDRLRAARPDDVQLRRDALAGTRIPGRIAIEADERSGEVVGIRRVLGGDDLLGQPPHLLERPVGVEEPRHGLPHRVEVQPVAVVRVRAEVGVDMDGQLDLRVRLTGGVGHPVDEVHHRLLGAGCRRFCLGGVRVFPAVLRELLLAQGTMAAAVVGVAHHVERQTVHRMLRRSEHPLAEVLSHLGTVPARHRPPEHLIRMERFAPVLIALRDRSLQPPAFLGCHHLPPRRVAAAEDRGQVQLQTSLVASLRHPSNLRLRGRHHQHVEAQVASRAGDPVQAGLALLVHAPLPDTAPRRLGGRLAARRCE